MPPIADLEFAVQDIIIVVVVTDAEVIQEIDAAEGVGVMVVVVSVRGAEDCGDWGDVDHGDGGYAASGGRGW